VLNNGKKNYLNSQQKQDVLPFVVIRTLIVE